MADGGYAAKNGAREAPIHRVKADGMTMGVRSVMLMLIAFD